MSTRSAPVAARPRRVPMLVPAPAQITALGAPATGVYRGVPDALDWAPLRGSFRRSALWRIFHHKRWHYLAMGNARFFVALAMVDVGWTNTAFVYVFDRERKQLRVDASCNGIPGLTASVSEHPLDHCHSWFRFKELALSIHSGDHGQLDVQATVGQQLALQARISPLPRSHCMTAIGPVGAGGCAHATVKSSAMRTRGTLRLDGEQFAMDDAVASFDFSDGLLARHTQWRWASAHSPSVGFNLQAGYFGAQENVLWLQGRPYRLGAAQFDFDPKNPLQPWHIHTDDGLLDLQFHAEGARQERKQLLVAASDYIQPIGTFSGTVRAQAHSPAVAVSALVGVTEDHQSTW